MEHVGFSPTRQTMLAPSAKQACSGVVRVAWRLSCILLRTAFWGRLSCIWTTASNELISFLVSLGGLFTCNTMKPVHPVPQHARLKYISHTCSLQRWGKHLISQLRYLFIRDFTVELHFHIWEISILYTRKSFNTDFLSLPESKTPKTTILSAGSTLVNVST